MAKDAIEKVTQADVDSAEEALEEGRKRLKQLHDAFVDGRGEWQDYLDQKAVIEFAEAQVLRVAADKRKYDEQVRQGGLAALRKEIDAESLASGDEFVSLLANVEDAVKAFAQAFQDRNAKIEAWRKRAEELGVGAMNGRLVPSSDDGGIGLVNGADTELRVGNRLLGRRYSGRILTSLVHSLATTSESVPYFRDAVGTAPMSGLDDVRATVANLDHEASAVPDDALFFRSRDGAQYMTDPDHAFSEEIMKRDGLRQISREEALNG